ncbi:helix-turn-helix domain-containing protein [Lamprobacter modestohalophilus]|uniref:helix-turn-helix domain-containing protein n=1 Tax=Lamprobacter modestohalophilus TaxID=1064514 RepID=UPI002ADEEB25|nr:helix-turn-helix domain-containing protein [Lamprobacter modestohalophilus]MEA1049679.1 helix-turn-helix domain-containing protein [Lamprobacter modestohalophilus]
MAQTATKGRDVFRQVLALRTEAEQATMDLGKRALLAHQALNVLYRKPILDAADLEKALNVTSPTANRLIKSMIEKDILVETTGQQRGRVYAFDRYIRLFLS